ncbi:MAG: hypothetical protein AMXMBFR64_10940 [Myxococcales bacterium]
MTGATDVRANTDSFEAAAREAHPEQGPTLGQRPPFVGRREELELLYNAVRDTVKKRRLHRVNIVGDAGTGKTRLVDEFFDLIESGSKRLHVVRCAVGEADGDGPLGVLAAVLRGLFGVEARDEEDVARRKITDRVLSILGRARPEDVRMLSALLGHGSAREALAGEPGGEPGWEAAVLSLGGALLTADAQRRPLFLVIDGFRWTDAGALAPVERFFEAVDRLPVLVLLVSRRPLPPALDKVPGERRSIALGPLSAADTERLARNVLDGVRGDVEPIVQALVTKSGGVPGLLVDILRVMALRGIVGVDGVGAWSAEPERLARTALPGTIGDASQLRVRELSERERGVLEKASVFGDTFWFSGVLSLMRVEPEPEPQLWWVEDVKQARLNKVLLDQQSRGMLEYRGASAQAGEPEFVFSSSLDREALLAGIPEKRLRRFQRLAGRWMLGRRPSTGGIRWFRTAGELLRAGGDPLGASDALLAGALAASEALNGDAALDLCTSARELLEDDEAARLLAINRCLAETFWSRGQWGEAAAALREALRLTVVVGDKPDGAHTWMRLGQALGKAGDREAARQALDASVKLLVDVGDLDASAEAQRMLRELTGRAPAGRIRTDRRT